MTTAHAAPGAVPPQLPAFLSGLELSRLLYEEAVRPSVGRRFPDLRGGAARIEAGSDVYGFDTPRSMDHGWGPALTLFIAEDDWRPGLGDELKRVLGDELPHEVHGFPTFMGEPEDESTILWRYGQMVMTTERPIKHAVGVGPDRAVIRAWIGVDPLRDTPLTLEEWLVIPSHHLRELTSGAVYRDDTGVIARAREAVGWYPHDVWLYLLAAQWLRIDQESAFMGRCGEVGDELGSRVVAARLVREVMRLCYLMERRHQPYTKWFGSGFARLACAPRLTPRLLDALRGETWQDRDRALAAAYDVCAEMHNALGLTEPLAPKAGLFHTRPFHVLEEGRFWKALRDRVRDPDVRRLMRTQHHVIGNTTQWADSTDALTRVWYEPQRALYRHGLSGGPQVQR
jgi:Domain of unknown function (DUF4037)